MTVPPQHMLSRVNDRRPAVSGDGADAPSKYCNPNYCWRISGTNLAVPGNGCVFTCVHRCECVFCC